jgi:hypothetical protein
LLLRKLRGRNISHHGFFHKFRMGEDDLLGGEGGNEQNASTKVTLNVLGVN